MKASFSVCSFCGCGCGIRYNTDDNGKICALPSMSNDIGAGSLCMKGWQSAQVYSSDKRLTKPLRRTDSGFEEISWVEAFKLFAEKLKAVKNPEKETAVICSAKTTNEEACQLSYLTRKILKTNNIDSAFTLNYSPLLSNLNELEVNISLNDIENADFILIIGSNLHTESPQTARRVISAVDKGAKLAVISSMKLLIAKLANTSVVFDPDKMRKFVKKLCSVSGDISQSTGSKGEAEVIYSKFKAAKMPVVIVGEDVFKGHFSGEDLRMILTAFKSRVFPVFNLNNVLGAVSYGLTPCADVSYLEKVWNTELPKSKGMNILEIIKAASEGSIKCLYVTGENIAVSAGNSDRVTEALNKVDFLVVQELFMTETALLADLILPAASSIEKSGTFTNTEGRIREVNEIRKPIANTKTDFAIFTEIIDKMGGTALYKKPEDAAKDLPRLNFLKQKKYICNVNDISVQEAADEKYPLWLKTDNSRIMFHTGSLLRNSEMLTREMIKQAVFINSDYAKKNSFRSGEKVRIVSRTGSLERPLLLLPELPEETLVFRTNITDASYSGLMPLGCKWTTVRLEKIK